MTSALYLVAYAVGGYRQAIEGVTKLWKERELEVDLLMVVAAIGAAAIGAWGDGALLILIFALSGTIEGYASARTKRGIEALMALRPEEALVERGGEEVTVPASSLLPGDVVIVRPGERIPADGRVVEGSSTVDQASITGESMPVDKRAGDEVFAGTINGHGALRVVASRPAAETVLARIVKLVEEAREKRPPAQLFIERFERGYAKYVVAGALLLAIAPPLLLGWTFRAALYRSMIFLVVASPCALAAAMMPALLSALSNGARSGILFKGSVFVEAMGRLDAVAFDKTGTLTTGAPRVTDVIALDGGEAAQVLSMAAAVESLSNHPLGRAIVAEAGRRGLVVPGRHGPRGRGRAGGTRHRGRRAPCRRQAGDVLVEVPAGCSNDVVSKPEGWNGGLVGDAGARGLIALRDTIRPRRAPRSRSCAGSGRIVSRRDELPRAPSSPATCLPLEVVEARRRTSPADARTTSSSRSGRQDGGPRRRRGRARAHRALRDTIRPEARPAIAELRRLGVRHVVMLTGDGERAARAVAGQGGHVDEVYADLLPQDKTRVVEDLVRRYGSVAMVGDGVNDSPALAAARPSGSRWGRRARTSRLKPQTSC